MAKIDEKISAIIKELGDNKYKPMYILHGEEPYYIDIISNYIEQHALKEEDRDFNQIVLYGADTNAAQIADQARCFPMMAERQVIIVKEAQGVKNWDQLETYLDNPQPTSVIVICHKTKKIDGRKKIVAKASKIGVVFDSTRLWPNELPGFVGTYVQQKYPKVSIDQKAVMMIVEHIGNDLSRITSELDKVMAALPQDANHITPEIVEERVGISKEYNGFELQDALASHDVEKSLRIADYFAKDPKVKDNVFSMMSGLFNFFQNLMIAHYAPGPKTDVKIAEHLSLRGAWHARNYVAAMKHYNAMKTLLIITKIRDTDRKMKGVNNRSSSAGDLLKELVFFILY